MIARRDKGQDRQRVRGLPRGHKKGPRRPFQTRQLFLQRARGGRAVKTIGIALVAPLAARCIGGGIGKGDGRGAVRRDAQRHRTHPSARVGSARNR